MQERLDFNSRSPFEIYHILNNYDSLDFHPSYADLFLPKGEGPFSCVVAIHGSRGWQPHHEDHIQNWLASGIAVCKIQSFSSRSVESIVKDQISVTHAMMLADAFSVKTLLDRDQRISKIGVAGWSLGGTVAIYSAWSPLIEVLGTPFVAHLPIYPAAHLRPDVKKWSNSPMLILHGTADDWTPISLVEGLLPQLPNTILHSYSGSHHAFDSVQEKTWLPEVIRLGKRTVRIEENGYMSGIWKFGIRFPLNEISQRRFVFRILRNRGAHVAGDSESRADALQRSLDFLLSNLN